MPLGKLLEGQKKVFFITWIFSFLIVSYGDWAFWGLLEISEQFVESPENSIVSGGPFTVKWVGAQ